MSMKELEKYAVALQRRVPPRYSVKKSKVKPRLKKIAGVKAVLIDIYGTFLTGTTDDLELGRRKLGIEKTIEEFGLEAGWEEVRQLYRREIEEDHKRKRKKGVQFPEVLIEDIWAKILRRVGKGRVNKFKIAYFFDWVLDRNKTYPYAFETLQNLREKGLKIGIASNAQFYTPINLNIVLKRQSRGRIKKWQGFFSPDLCGFSYKLGFSKPNKRFFEKQKNKFKPSEMLFVGNDMLNDIWGAKRAGLKTLLFAGDAKSLRLRKGDRRARRVKPDAVVTDWRQLLKVVG